MPATISSEVTLRHEHFLDAHERHAASEAELVKLLVEMDEKGDFRELGFSSIHDYTRVTVQWERGKTEAMLRLGRSLKGLKKLERSLAEGEVSATKVREIARVATPRTEAKWIEVGRTHTYSQIERLVASTSKGLEPGVLSPGEEPRPVLRRLRWELREETVASLEEAVEAIRGTGVERLDLDRAIVKLIEAARRGLGGKEAGSEKAGKSLEPRRRPWLLLIECPTCKGKALQTRDEEVPVSEETATVLGEGAVKIAAAELPHGRPKTPAKRPQTEVEAVEDRPPFPGWKRTRPAIPTRLRALVFARARFRCEMPGCSERRWLEVGHIGARRNGGWENPSNYCAQCFRCNQAELRGLIKLVGPYERLQVFDRAGRRLTEMGPVHRSLMASKRVEAS